MDNKIIQISSGRGPAECAWVVAQVLKIFLAEARDINLETIILHKENGVENGTVISVTIQLKGKKVSEFVNSWVGTIQWIGKSQFRKFHKRKNWFISVFEIKNSKQIIFNENNVTYQAIRSSGNGGQNLNKVSSAVRATDSQTSISVLATDSRSQHQNKKLALERLKAKVEEANLNFLKDNEQQNWLNQMDIERGNAVRTFTGTDFKKQKVEKTYKNERNNLKKGLRDELNR
jgi:peptide chain release factor